MPRSPLISPDELAAALRSPDPPTVLDVRWRLGGPPGIDEYRRGHVPGAVYVDLDAQLAAPPGAGGRHPLPDEGEFQQAMRAAGVDNGRAVVVYDDTAGMSAARAWWLLRDHGHTDVRLLDGGYSAWVEDAKPIETGDAPTTSHHGDFTISTTHAMPTVDAAGAAAVARDGVLLDARAAERYRGETEPVDPVAGHIPHARSLPTAGNVGAGGRFLDAATLAQRFRDAGVRPGVPAATYCGSGVNASHQVLAAEVAGITLALYPGSWSEWITDPGRPVATGEEPPRRPD